MIETRDYEVFCIEENLVSEEVLNAFSNESGRNVYLIIMRNGEYRGFLNYDILKNNINTGRLWREDKILVGKELFARAREYFSDSINRDYPLPVVDENGQILTFLVWNYRLEKELDSIERQKVKIKELFNAGNVIELNNWDEYTDVFYKELLLNADEEKRKNIRCSGRNWDVCSTDITVSTENVGENVIRIDGEGIHYPSKEHEVISLYDITEKYDNKRIYAWLNTFKSIYGISKLFFQNGYIIEGFCELKEQREISHLLGKKVENLEDVVWQDNVLILVSAKKEVEFLKKYISQERVLCYEELYEWKTSAMNDRIFQTWGDMKELAEFYKTAPKTSIKIGSMNRVDNSNPALMLWEYKVNKGIKEYATYVGQISKDVPWYAKEHVHETTGHFAGMQRIKSFDLAIKENKKIILYGTDSHYTNQWIHILEKLELSFTIMDEEEAVWFGYEVESIYDLPYYDLDNVLVIVNKPYAELHEALELLGNYGVSFEKHNAVSSYEHIMSQSRGDFLFDYGAGFVPQVMINEKYPGYCVLGECGENDYKIMVLGGSTTDGTHFTYSSWPEILYKNLNSRKKRVTILNGAVGGYSSAQELTKLARDIQYIKPDMIISFSGINDTIRDNDLPPGCVRGMEEFGIGKFSSWFSNEKVMNTISEMFGSKFYCFAQPMLYQNDTLNKYEQLYTKEYRRLDEPSKEIWKKQASEVKGYSWFVDLSDILDNNADVYFDLCHVTTQGNEIIAEHIMKHIIDNIP